MDKAQSITGNYKAKHAGQKQIFKNPVLERLSRTHIAVPLSGITGNNYYRPLFRRTAPF